MLQRSMAPSFAPGFMLASLSPFMALLGTVLAPFFPAMLHGGFVPALIGTLLTFELVPRPRGVGTRRESARVDGGGGRCGLRKRACSKALQADGTGQNR
jgi:hypothetical protein